MDWVLFAVDFGHYRTGDGLDDDGLGQQYRHKIACPLCRHMSQPCGVDAKDDGVGDASHDNGHAKHSEHQPKQDFGEA